MEKEEIKRIVRKGYAGIAVQGSSCCGTSNTVQDISREIGYTDKELKAVPEGANLGLGCGNPAAMASLKKGEVVLDLGSGSGLDCFLAAERVGETGKVICVDMTPEMIEKAKSTSEKMGVRNVEFMLGDIETLPVENNSVDVVISNCVINLSPDKEKVFQEIYRVLKPGGRVVISDIALNKELPACIRKNLGIYVGCISGAVLVDDYKSLVESSGLKDVKITAGKISSCIASDSSDPVGRAITEILGENESVDDYGSSLYIEGRK